MKIHPRSSTIVLVASCISLALGLAPARSSSVIQETDSPSATVPSAAVPSATVPSAAVPSATVPSAAPVVSAPPSPPIAERRPFTVISKYGRREDDYYWLRDDARTSADVLDYLHRENAYRDAVMAPTIPLQKKLFAELSGREQPDEKSAPVFEHDYWYYQRYEPGQDYAIYARRKGSMTAPEEIILDGPAMSKGHDFFAIGSISTSPNGRYVAYTEDLVGRRQYTLKFKDLVTGQTLGDSVPNVEPDIQWAADNARLLYIEKDPVTLLSTRVRAHALGTRAGSDTLIYEEKDHSYYVALQKSRSEEFLFIALDSTQQSEVRYARAADPDLRFKPVIAREKDLRYRVEALGNDFIIQTNWQAPNQRIVRVPIKRASSKSAWRDVLPLRADAFIENFEVSDRFLIVNERQQARLSLRLRPWNGGKDEIIRSDDAAGTVDLIPTPDLKSAKVRWSDTSLIAPSRIKELDTGTGRTEIIKTTVVLGGFDQANYRTTRLQAAARDGTLVPVTVAYRLDTRIDGSAPLLQYAYGSYGASSDPEFTSEWVSLMDRGFVVAIAHIRGGQELGRAWYEGGRQLHKKNTFTDFIDVTHFLVQSRYAARDKVFAEGGSAGGLLMGAVANMAPQDYRGIIAYVPFVDVVTSMLDDSIPLTSNEFDEWGNPAKKPFYDYMLSYSPYDNVGAREYPAMLVFTALWDSQVQYYEPAKWVAKLRAMKTDRHTLVFTIDEAAGHGGKSGRLQRFGDNALEYAFILNELGPQQRGSSLP